MTEHKRISADELNSFVEFDRPFRVHADGTVSDSGVSLANIYAPEVYHQETDEYGNEMDFAGDTDWFAWSAGYTGQYSYNGPVLHPSEYLGGRIARDLLDQPGVYVVCAVEVIDCDDICEEDCSGEHEPAGWTVLRLSRHEITDIVQCVDCWLISNNGTGNGDADEEAAHVALMDSHERTNPTPEGWSYAPGDYEWDFATFTCDTCGSRHGGTWNRAHYFYPRTRALTEHETAEWLAGRLTVDHPVETEDGVTVREDRR